MLSIRRLLNEAGKKIIANVHEKGYAHIETPYYLQSCPQAHANLKLLQNSYQHLKIDTASPGSRYRAYTNYLLNPTQNKLIQNPNNDYFQPKSYNKVDGDRIRKFDQIDQAVLDNALMREVVEKDFALAKESNLVELTDDLEVGLHQIRYTASKTQPSYSSPSWLHRDNEPFVFVHLLDINKNVLGGDNVLATDVNHIDQVLRLTQPLETLLLSKKNLHAVTPMGSADANPANRDIMLVTFQNRKKLIDAAFFATKRKTGATPVPAEELGLKQEYKSHFSILP